MMNPVPKFDDPRAPYRFEPPDHWWSLRRFGRRRVRLPDPPHQRFFDFGILGAVFSAIAAEHKSDTVRQEWEDWYDSLTPGAQLRYIAASSYKKFPPWGTTKKAHEARETLL